MKTAKGIITTAIGVLLSGAVAHAQVGGLGDTLKQSAGDATKKGVNQQIDSLTGQGGAAVTPGAGAAGAAKEQAGGAAEGAGSMKKGAEEAADVEGMANKKAGTVKEEAGAPAEGSMKAGSEKAGSAAEKGGKAAKETDEEDADDAGE